MLSTKGKCTLNIQNTLIIEGILFFFIFKINLFIYFWLRWVFVVVRRLSLVVASGGYSLLQSTGSRHAGFSSCGARASVVVAHRLSSCGSRA